MTIVSSIFNNLAGHRARFLGGILCLAPLVFPLLVTGCTVNATTPAASCSLNSNVVCTNGVGTGYSCTGSAQPEQYNPDLLCNTNGVGDFCCVTSTTCTFNANVVGCVSGATGYSCAAGSARPDAADSTLVCSVPTTVSGLDEYCCYTNTTTTSTSTCEPDSTVAGCQPDSAGKPSYGFSCTGSESPATDFSNITCSTGTAGTDAKGNAASLFCCTYH